MAYNKSFSKPIEIICQLMYNNTDILCFVQEPLEYVLEEMEYLLLKQKFYD